MGVQIGSGLGLSEHEVLGSGVRKVLEFLTGERTRLLDELAGPKGEIATAHLRGRIYELQRLRAAMVQPSAGLRDDEVALLGE